MNSDRPVRADAIAHFSAVMVRLLVGAGTGSPRAGQDEAEAGGAEGLGNPDLLVGVASQAALSLAICDSNAFTAAINAECARVQSMVRRNSTEDAAMQAGDKLRAAFAELMEGVQMNLHRLNTRNFANKARVFMQKTKAFTLVS